MERMNRSRVNLMVATVCAMGLAGSARGDIHWLSGPSPTVSRSPEQVESAIASLARRPNDRHVVVRFAGPAGVDRRDALARAGVTLLSYVGDHAYFATLSNQNVDASAAVRLGLVEALAIETAWTLHPKYLRGEVPTHALVSGSISQGTATVAAYVLLHRDVTLAEGANLVAQHGGLIRDELRTVLCIGDDQLLLLRDLRCICCGELFLLEFRADALGNLRHGFGLAIACEAMARCAVF